MKQKKCRAYLIVSLIAFNKKIQKGKDKSQLQQGF